MACADVPDSAEAEGISGLPFAYTASEQKSLMHTGLTVPFLIIRVLARGERSPGGGWEVLGAVGGWAGWHSLSWSKALIMTYIATECDVHMLLTSLCVHL